MTAPLPFSPAYRIRTRQSPRSPVVLTSTLPPSWPAVHPQAIRTCMRFAPTVSKTDGEAHSHAPKGRGRTLAFLVGRSSAPQHFMMVPERYFASRVPKKTRALRPTKRPLQAASNLRALAVDCFRR